MNTVKRLAIRFPGSAAFIFIMLLFACQPENWPDNLLMNPNAEEGSGHWVSLGEASVDENACETPCFSVRNGGQFHQDVPISREHGQYALMIGCVTSDYMNPDGAITDLPYLYGYMMRDQNRIDAYLQGQHMRGDGIIENEWSTAWGTYEVPTTTTSLRFFLNQANMADVPYSGEAAYFDELGLYQFDSEARALRFVDNYMTTCGSASQVDIVYGNTLTILPNGETREMNLVGKKMLQISIEVGENRLISDPPTVVYWSDILDINDYKEATPVDNDDNAYTFVLPSSDELGLCDWMKYRWVVRYENTLLNNSGTLIGEERYVMPTSQYVGNNQLQQATCSSPEE